MELVTWSRNGVRYAAKTTIPDESPWLVLKIYSKVGPPSWQSVDHPRDRNGKFVRVGDAVTLFGHPHGTFVGVDARGRIQVRRNSDGRVHAFLRSQVGFDSKPESPVVAPPTPPKLPDSPAASLAAPPKPPEIPASPEVTVAAPQKRKPRKPADPAPPKAASPATAVMSPDFDEKERKAGHDLLNSAGKSVHPLAKPQGNEHHQASANAAAELATQLNNREDWERYRGYNSSLDRPLPLGKFEDHSEGERHTILANQINNRINTWASSSGFNSNNTVLMQEAIKQEFGVTGPSAPAINKHQFSKLMARHWPTHGPWFQRIARVMYENTQKEYAKAGITHVSAYRGLHFPEGEQPGWVKPGNVHTKFQPINSWTTSADKAANFSGRDAGGEMAAFTVEEPTTGVVLSASIPVELIFSTKLTGFGQSRESEVVVFDNDGQAKAEVFHIDVPEDSVDIWGGAGSGV